MKITGLLSIVAAAALLGLSAPRGFAQPPTGASQPQTKPTGAPAQPTKKAEPPKTESPAGEKPTNPPSSEPKLYYVKMTTSQGDIIIELNNEKAPISTRNFLAYVDKKQYDGTVFHRIIPNFMIQGGGFEAKDGKLVEKSTDKPIKNEWQNGLKNTRGTIAMARTSAPDSATCQFYINVVDNAALDVPRGGAAYAVFGKVIAGMDTVDKLKAVPTGTSSGMSDVPKDLGGVTIKSVTRLTEDEAKKLMTSSPKKEEPAKK